MHAQNRATVWIGALEASCPRAEIRDFAAIYQAWFRPVYRWIRKLAGPGASADAEDLTQEVFIIVQRKLDGFDGTNLAGWLYRIAQRTVRDHRRRTWYRNIFLRPRELALDQVASTAEGSYEHLDRMELERKFYDLVRQLNPKWRDSFLLFEIGGLRCDEIARLTGIPAVTVRTHLFRARKEMIALAASLSVTGAPGAP